MFRPRGFPAAGMSLSRTEKRDGRRRLCQRVMQISMIGAGVMGPDVRPPAAHVKAFSAQGDGIGQSAADGDRRRPPKLPSRNGRHGLNTQQLASCEWETGTV